MNQINHNFVFQKYITINANNDLASEYQFSFNVYFLFIQNSYKMMLIRYGPPLIIT
jgi:hypothetical protein